jgi:hypothetical protein
MPRGKLAFASRPTGKPTTGSVLAGALLFLALLALVGATLMDRALHGTETAAWSRDHLVLRNLAESAAEELSYEFQVAANSPEHPLYQSLRTLVGQDRAIGQDTFALSAFQRERAALERVSNTKVQVVTNVTLEGVRSVSPDPREKLGRVTIDVTVSLKRLRMSNSENVHLVRLFRVSRVTPPRPFDQLALFIGQTTEGDLSQFQGRPALAISLGSPTKLLDLMSLSGPIGGFTRPKSSNDPLISRAMATLSPVAMASRAQFLVRSPEELTQLIKDQSRAYDAVNGVIHMTASTPVRIALPAGVRFKGKCIISSLGPIEAGDIWLEDPALDSLTLVTPQRFDVTGRHVEANLLQTSTVGDGVAFHQRSSLTGVVVSRRFPHAVRLSPGDFGDCEFQNAPYLNSGTSPDDAADANLLSRYYVVTAPYPVDIQHGRDRDEKVTR